MFSFCERQRPRRLRILAASFSVVACAKATPPTGDAPASVSTGDFLFEEVPHSEFSDCELGCANGGYCRFVHGTEEDLARAAMSGALVESCRCPEGFTGKTCQFLAGADVPPERRCQGDETNAETQASFHGCDCAFADAVSDFAGAMCRSPVTEYCGGGFGVQSRASVSFCTNGGRCRKDVIEATFLPKDPEGGRSSDGTPGCLCPRNFYGPHCEFLRMDPSDGNLVFAEVEVAPDDDTRLSGGTDPSSTSPSASSLRSTVDYETATKSRGAATLVFLLAPVTIGLLALSVCVSRTFLARHPGAAHRTGMLQRARLFLRRSNGSKDHKTGALSSSLSSKPWDGRSDTSSDCSDNGYRHCCSYADDENKVFDQVNFNEEDELGIASMASRLDLGPIDEDTERPDAF